jgi:hypothetical protein
MTRGSQDNQHEADGHRRVTASALRASWLSRSLERGWPDPVGWRTPAVDGVVDALLDTNGSVDQLETALGALAWERASDTLHLDTALDDLDALWSVLEAAGAEPISLREARWGLIDAWADALAVDRDVPCIDPLSGLHTAGYLLGRIRELDRIADDAAPLVLLSMRWHRPAGPWRRIGTVLSAAAVLQENVRPDATLARDGYPGCAGTRPRRLAGPRGTRLPGSGVRLSRVARGQCAGGSHRAARGPAAGTRRPAPAPAAGAPGQSDFS